MAPDDVLRVGQLLLTSTLVITVLALICNIVVLTGRRAALTDARAAHGKARAGVGARTSGSDDDALVDEAEGVDETEEVPRGAFAARTIGDRLPKGLALYATGFTAVSVVLLVAYLVMRTITSGYSPFANQHEFAVSFAFGILLAYLLAEYRYRIRALSMVVLPVVIALLVYANSLDMTIKPLVPALKDNLMLTLHVAFAVLSYGAACVSFGAASLYLAHPYLRVKALPSQEVLDDIGYKAAAVTYPLLTLMIVMGSIWANTAWGRYWGWDPKETAALVTWLIYTAYLHTRVTRGWQGSRSAWMLILGFAAVLFAYFGNHFFGGLHSYG
ncbi:c-type cytochrome biogenesis protein CcsB [Schaalia sp. 19OD2882]|uniref:c-type cytochrome biogenesis protein CcsB n=1 Tax=Schaalia sp. 19OD2882 TaxID=2794089 RepID=UPI001C1ED72D|nr:c-type cytochrome biogenesis protein CcsB [Schaalia sp. 19OD2882]QWW18893.1 c-type cytochrome biogenesis protein CcsB [Schaalia sp. 19OD2882]